MCTGCREMKPKKELIRVVKTSEGEIKLDTTGKLNGRGAYICRDRQCFNNAKKSNALARAFGMQISDEIYTQLETELENIITNLPALDLQKILNNIDKLNQKIGLDNILYLTCPKCGEEVTTFFRFGPEFFRPTTV